ncbi:cyclin-D5-1-like [Miscanthus floridulus]|uniref:cyclin-D5-1-like n=1 Tax=Miscanthus floridulus TaxID=154761 RepID=UPI003459E372
MGEAQEGCSAGCSFSLMCLEDGADLDAAAGSAESADDAGRLAAFLYSDAGEEDQEEYMDHLVSKESSFCCSPCSSSSPSPVFCDIAGAEPCLSSTASPDDWFRCARRATVEWIFETRAYFGFSHRTAYLAISYMDRFCLHRCMDRSVMPWAARLLAVACVSLAAKMEEYRAPALSEFRADDEYDFSSVCIRRMELLVLSTLGWRMGDVTPLDYLPCLSSRLPRDGGGGGGGLVAAKAAALIFSAAESASVLDYRPSTVAVAAVLAAAHGAMAKEALESKMSSLSPSCLLDKDDVHACYSTMLSESSSATPSKLAAKRPPPPTSSGSTTFSSVDAASSLEAAADSNKRSRLELPAVVGA